jgi:galactose mutarotase-like enzyme
MSIGRVRRVNGFSVHTLVNESVSIGLVPQLGGRVVSLRDRAAGREWLDGWAPASTRRLWAPSDPAVFETGPGAGLDECFPTVLPCRVNGRDLPDHGELWNSEPSHEFVAVDDGAFTCRWQLHCLPLTFERRIVLHGRSVRFEYRVGNTADVPTPFLWAWHPLFSLRRGDQLVFAPSVKTCFPPGGGALAPWPCDVTGNDLSRAKIRPAAPAMAKVFVGPLETGSAEIRSARGARLCLAWPADLFPYAGVWITRGFWKGLHHWAVEPTNAAVDRLSDIEGAGPVSTLAPNEIRSWTLIVRLERG